MFILKKLQKPLQLKIFFFQNSNTPDCSYVPKIETKKRTDKKKTNLTVLSVSDWLGCLDKMHLMS